MQIGKWPHLRILGSGPTFMGRVLSFVCPKSWLALPISFFNNRMGVAPLVPVAFKVGSKVWVRYLRVIEGHPEGDAI